MIIIGLTGGIASGKSTVAAMLHRRGLPLIDADQLAREVVAPGTPAWHEILEVFGQPFRLPDGAINRKALGELVFADPQARKRLEAIVHPRISVLRQQKLQELQHAYVSAGKPLPLAIVYDIPLLFETGQQHTVDQIWVVWIPREMQIERLMKRNGLTRREAEIRLEAQLPLDEKRQWADVVIDNSRSLAETEQQVEAAWQRLRQQVDV